MSRRLGALVVLAIWILVGTGCESFRARMHMKRGNELYKAEKYEEAIEEYKKILEREPDDWEANYLTAVSYLALYHPGSTHPKDRAAAEGAIAALEKLNKLRAPDDETREKVRNYYLGLLTATENTDKALTYLESVLHEDPKNLALIRQLAGLYAKKGDIENALRYYQKVADLEPNAKENWYTIGVICWERSYRGGLAVSNEEREVLVEKGLAALQRALSIDPDYFDALSYANLLYREQYKVLAATGRQQEAGMALLKAEEYFKKAMDARKKGQTSTAGA